LARGAVTGGATERMTQGAVATEVLAGIDPLLERYDGFLVDKFGVIFDGMRVMAGAHEALALLQRAGKRVVILSNSGRRSAPNEGRLTRLGIGRALYQALVSSGEATWQGLHDRTDPTFVGLGRHCLFFSRGGDRSTVDGLDLALVETADAADFVLLAGLDHDDATRARCAEQLALAAGRGLPLLCANPDLVSLEHDTLVQGPGAFAARYAEAGGEVRYVGKPWPVVYRAALALLDLPPARVLAIGDSLDHDIAGAAPFGVDGALSVEGVHAGEFADTATGGELLDHLDRLCLTRCHHPRWLLRGFRPAR
jgi:HAD superfamily hydrolase (TIGR01459 family)